MNFATGANASKLTEPEPFGPSDTGLAWATRPSISSEIGTGTSFVNFNGETGIVTPPEDVAALAEAMRTLAAQPEQAEALGRAARQRYETLFRAEAMAEAYLEVYRELLGRN